ncbi:hypothetical protein OF829_03585 [Sphingomonas sp. LB-2]|uniref:cupredoxin domain-containing protein n=1 Tax=Sphingomonas caeni TaxID=2984949 RepID=UPI002231FCB8|nr:hypothetical protein [Sphingomonas caeni]MCW3846308.1 hypothetical protein [Sphingomonas caeni]
MQPPSWILPLRRHPIAAALAAVLLAGLGWAALAPIELASHEAVFEIPRGTSARHMAGEKIDILPQTIRLTLGLNDILVFKNADTAPHIFGPTLIMPGQTFRLPFSQASTYSFQCTAHANGQLNIIVDPNPAPGWERLSWRFRKLMGGA